MFFFRDIGGSDPERMAPPRVEEYVREAFKDSGIDIKVGALRKFGAFKLSKEYRIPSPTFEINS